MTPAKYLGVEKEIAKYVSNGYEDDAGDSLEDLVMEGFDVSITGGYRLSINKAHTPRKGRESFLILDGLSLWKWQAPITYSPMPSTA